MVSPRIRAISWARGNPSSYAPRSAWPGRSRLARSRYDERAQIDPLLGPLAKGHDDVRALYRAVRICADDVAQHVSLRQNPHYAPRLHDRERPNPFFDHDADGVGYVVAWPDSNHLCGHDLGNPYLLEEDIHRVAA